MFNHYFVFAAVEIKGTKIFAIAAAALAKAKA